MSVTFSQVGLVQQQKFIATRLTNCVKFIDVFLPEIIKIRESRVQIQAVTNNFRRGFSRSHLVCMTCK